MKIDISLTIHMPADAICDNEIKKKEIFKFILHIGKENKSIISNYKHVILFSLCAIEQSSKKIEY